VTGFIEFVGSLHKADSDQFVEKVERCQTGKRKHDRYKTT